MLKDSAPDKWEYREHTRVKHILLEKYLVAWISILGKWNPRICYFDGFAGKGEYREKILGSPIISLKTADRLSKYFGEFVCIFIEKDKDNFLNLEKILEREMPNIKNRGKIKIIKENEEFANVIGRIFKYLEKEKAILVPSFFFVDPFGFSGIPFGIIQKILANPKTEVFFTFMVRDLARFIEHPGLIGTFTDLFGTEEWKEVIKEPDREKGLIELYRRQLHEAAGVKYSWHFRICESEKLRTLYYLVHASNNFKGHSIMKSVMYNQSAQGDFAYLGPKDVTARSQLQLFDVEDIEQLKKHLIERLKGETLTFGELQEKMCHPWYSEPPFVEKHFKKALKELDSEKAAKVTGKGPRGGIRDSTKITFPKNNGVKLISYRSVHRNTSRIRIHYKEYEQLDGKKEVLVSRVNDGSIITRFDKTPLPETEKSVVCPHFLELKWAYGCPYDCSWCYLKGTFRFQPKKASPVVKPYEKIERHTQKFLEEVKIPEILNAGEIADSLMHEEADVPFSKLIIPMFEEQSQHKILFLTKSSSVNNLLEIEPHKQVIVSFSLNAIPVAERWEKAPSILKRIEAAKKVFDVGYEVRIRIDPMVPINGWEKHYFELLDIMFESFTPERITLGSLRGLQTTINGCSDRSWVKYLTESSNWGKKIDLETRWVMYSKMIKQLNENYGFNNTALCKETIEMWNLLGEDYKRIACNCVY